MHRPMLPPVTPLPGRVLARLDYDPSGCLLWTGPVSARGWGVVWDEQRRATARVHRYVYERLRGPIPDGLTLDHLCGVKRCASPLHLEPVTAVENHRRYFAAMDTCQRGHSMSDAVQRGGGRRTCRTCRDTRMAAYRKARKEQSKETLDRPPDSP